VTTDIIVLFLIVFVDFAAKVQKKTEYSSISLHFVII